MTPTLIHIKYYSVPRTNWFIFSLLSACLFWNSCKSLVTFKPFGVKMSGFRLIRYSDSFDVISDTVVKMWDRWADALSIQYLKWYFRLIIICYKISEKALIFIQLFRICTILLTDDKILFYLLLHRNWNLEDCYRNLVLRHITYVRVKLREL